MRKLFLLTLSIISINCFCQPIKQYLGSSKTMLISKGTSKSDSGLYVTILDTLNHPYKDSVGMLTVRPQNGRLYVRGLTKWDLVSGNDWTTTGNSGTNPVTNFIGTTDEQPLIFKANNQKAGRIDYFLNTANTFYGYKSGNVNSGVSNTGNGYYSLLSNTTGGGNTANGVFTLLSNTTGLNNTAVGNSALLANNGSYNTAIGSHTLESNTTGSGNQAIGSDALIYNTTGSSNTAIGYLSMNSNIGGGANLAIGFESLYSNTTGSGNTATGILSLFGNTTGTYNTGLGYNTNVLSENLTNATAVGYGAAVGASNSLVLGSINGVNSASSDTKVGIGVTSPSERLHVVGNLRLVNGSQSPGRFLQTDANGVATWVDAPAEVGTVQSVSVVSANGFSATVANATTTPAITMQTTVTGLIKGDGTAISSATADVDYATPAYADAKVADAIGNGVTTIAPSQNAVYDALALKQDNIGYTTENVANKENVTIDNSTTKYPTVNLLKTGLDTKLNISDTAAMLANYLLKNASITGATKTKITYDTKGLVTAGADATTDDIIEGANEYYTDAKVVAVTGPLYDPIGSAAFVSSLKVTKGGDAGANLLMGTTTAHSVTIKTDNTARMFFGTNGNVGIGTASPLFKLHLWGNGGNGAGAILGFGDGVGADPRVSLSEYGGTDTDQPYLHGQQGLFLGAGTFGTRNFTIQADGDIIYGGTTQVAGAEHTFIGDGDVSGNMNVQGNLTANNIINISGVLDFPSTAAGTSSELTIAVAGAAVGDAIAPGIPTSNANSMYEYRASGVNVVTVKFNNYSAAAINPASATFKGKLFK